MSGRALAPESQGVQVFFAEEFPSTIEAMDRTLDRAVRALVADGWLAQEQAGPARLCLEESLVNAVRHGNRNDPERQVRLELASSGDRCLIRVHDEGGGFHPEQVRMPDAEHMGGRGVCLMRHYMEYIKYNEACKCLEMAFRRGHCAAGG